MTLNLNRRPVVVAHRGDSAAAPENTLIAFRRALDLGVPGLELDVHRTADGQIIAMHDATVDRTTDGSGAIASLTFAEIRRLDAGAWKGPEFAGERVPTLAEVCEVARGRAFLFVEIKAEGIAAEVLRILKETGMEGQAIPISFSAANVRQVKELRPEMTVGFLTSHAEDLPRLDELGAEAFCVHYKAATEAMAQQLHQADRLLSVWTVNDPDEMRRMAQLGADFLTSDYPARALEVLS